MSTAHTDPSLFGLPSSTVLEENGDGSITLVKNRKSRIIMKDGKRIVQIMKKVMSEGNYKSFILKTNAPLCSKTKAFLEENGIRIIMT